MHFKLNTITNKLLIFIVGASIILGFGLILITSAEMLDDYETKIDELNHQRLDHVQDHFDIPMVNIEASLHTLKIQVDDMVANNPTKETLDNQLTQLFKQYLSSNADVTESLYIYFEPTSQSDVLDVWLSYDKGEIIRHDQIPFGRYEARENMSWFYDVKEMNVAHWVSPYYNRYDDYITSYVIPLYNNGNFIGIMGMYLNLSNITPPIFETDAYVWVLDDLGKIIYHPTLTPGSMSPANKLPNSGYAILDVNQETERHYVLTTEEKWQIIYAVKEASILEPRMVLINKVQLVFIVFILSLALFLYFVFNKYSRNLKDMTEALVKAQNNDFSMTVPVLGRDELGDLGYTLNNSLDLIHQHIKKLERYCYYNGKTQLPNLEKLKNDLLLHDQDSLHLYLINIDSFSKINQIIGRKLSNEMLKEIGEKLNQSEVCPLTVYHTYGDEFALIDYNDKMSEIVSYIHQVFDDITYHSKYNLMVTTSIGAARYPEDVSFVGGLIDCARIAMSEAKKSGKNQFAMYSRFLEGVDDHESYLEYLKTNILNQQVEILYQPVYNDQMTCTSFLTEVNWIHPVHGLLSVEPYLSAIDNNELLEIYSSTVLNLICHDTKAFIEQHESFEKMIINISMRQILDPLFLSHTLAIIRSHHIPLNRIQIMINESILSFDINSTLKKLEGLTALGVEVILANFSGSIESLNVLPIHKIGLAPLLTNQITNESTYKLLNGMTKMFHMMSIDVMATQINDKKIFEKLKSIGINYYTGPFISPSKSIESILESNKK